jgi:hypothetical protein
MLEPPLVLGQDTQWVNGGIGIGVIDSGNISTFAIHAIGEGSSMGSSWGR